MVYLSGAISNDINYKVKFSKYHKILSKLFSRVIYNPVLECELRDIHDFKDCLKFNLLNLKNCKYMLIIKDNINCICVSSEIAFCESNNIPYNYIYIDEYGNLIIESNANKCKI